MKSDAILRRRVHELLSRELDNLWFYWNNRRKTG